ncbi:unnamed protein product, partial [Rhizoctonia solani]
MSKALFPVDFDQAQRLLNRTHKFLQVHPLESSITLAAASLAGYTSRHLIMLSQYPNIDGPSHKDVTFGHLFDIYSPEGIPFHDELPDKYGLVSKFNGMFGKEDIFVSDPRFLHEALVKGVDVVRPTNQRETFLHWLWHKQGL